MVPSNTFNRLAPILINHHDPFCLFLVTHSGNTKTISSLPNNSSPIPTEADRILNRYWLKTTPLVLSASVSFNFRFLSCLCGSERVILYLWTIRQLSKGFCWTQTHWECHLVEPGNGDSRKNYSAHKYVQSPHPLSSIILPSLGNVRSFTLKSMAINNSYFFITACSPQSWQSGLLGIGFIFRDHGIKQLTVAFPGFISITPICPAPIRFI